MDQVTRQKLQEINHFVAFLEIKPDFAGSKILSFHPGEAPDVVCIDDADHAIGVEVTQWLMGKQSTIAKGWEEILSAATKSVKLPPNVNGIVFSFASAVHFFGECDACLAFMGALGPPGGTTRQQQSKINSYSDYTRCSDCKERFSRFSNLRHDIEAELRVIMAAAAAQTPESEGLEVVSFSCDRFPGKPQIASDCFLERVDFIIGPPSIAVPRPIVEFGGAFAPGLAAAALRHGLTRKLTKRNYQSVKEQKNLSKLYLLVVYDDAILRNTPFGRGAPVEMASAVARQWAGLFDGVFLLLYPDNPVEPSELAPGVPLGGRGCYQIFP